MKKFFAALAFIFCLLLVSCKTETTYKITYHNEGSTVEILYSPNEVIPNKDILGSSKDGYELEGWYLDASYSSMVSFPYTVTESVDFYARWIKLHTITLMNGSSTLKTEKVKDGQTLNNPGDPQITGAGAFMGWSSNKDSYVPFDFTTRIEADLILYAFFEEPTPLTITISFMDGETLVETKEIQENTVVSKVTAPSKTGYTFKGWSTKKEEFVEFNFETKLIEDTTLYAFYTKDDVTPEMVTVTFKDEDTILDSKTVEKNSVVSAVTAPSKTGYTFKGWSTKQNEYEAYDFATLVENDLTLYAIYEINTYTVTYKYNDTVYTTQSIEYNSTTTAPKAPIITGYIFKEWCVDEECKIPFDFSTQITEDITLYAKLEEVTTHTLTLIIDGKQTVLQINHDSTIDTANIPAKEGYEVKAWYTDSSYTTIFDVTTKITKDTTLYGSYTIISYTVILIDGSTSSEKKVEHNSLVVFPNDPSKTGYTFKGWSTKQDEFVEFKKNTPITKDITLYAYYTIQSYTITFINEDSTVKSETLEYNSSITLPETPTKLGYTFKGWSTSSTSYIAFDNTTKVTKNLTLYAFFDINTYTVTFIKDSSEYQKSTVEYNSTVTLPAAPSKTGYTFKGWSNSSTSYVAFVSTTKITGDTTLYAYFEIQTFTVTFMNGNTKLGEETVNYNSTVAVPSSPSKTGWIFKGWSTKEDALVAFNSNTKITSNMTIYAYFVEEFTVTFNVDGTKTTTKVEDGNKVTEPEVPTKSGYIFTGWYLDDTQFDFNTPITDSIELVARFVSLQDAPIEITNYSGYNEGLFFEATPIAGASLSDYTVQYKLATDSSWKTVDEELIREENNKIRCDVVGIPAGSYQVKLDVNGKSKTISCEVAAQDRSGYAHFNYTSGVGAYKDDGTLKSDAIVVYVTNETKNTVTVGSYTGLVNIIQNQSKIKKPLDIRIIGKITTNQYAPKSDAPRLPDGSNSSSTFFTNSLEQTYGTNLVGLTVQYMDKLEGKSYKFLTTETGLKSNGTGSSSVKTTTYSRDAYPELTGKTVLDDDSYFNMLDIDSASNVTIEGIGTNAEFFQFGITWKKCNSIEVKNITFTDYPEDACSFEAGSNSDVNNYGHYWVHNNTFNRGKNNWDVSGERDKYAGDGGIDLKYINSVTLAYNKFDNCKKTGLVGGDNKNYTKNITFHHNYYYKVESRLPLGRQANMHIYNNYYEECGTCQDIRANAFVFSEANYFYKCTTAQKVSTDSTYTGTIIKSFNDYYDGGSKYNSTQAIKATSRTQSLSGNCKPDGSTDYTNFDTNSTLFYYTGSASKVSVLHSNAEVPDFCKTYSGVLKSNITSGVTPDPTPSGEYSITYVSAHGTVPTKVNNASSLPNPLPVLTETGWTFKGWYTKSTYEESSKAVAGSTLTQNVTLYAKWEESSQLPTTDKVTITFDSLTTGTVTSVTTSTGATVQKGNSSKDIKIAEASNTVNGTKLSKYVNVAGGGNYTDLSITFTTSKKANITIYYANPGSSGADRYIALYTADGLVNQESTGAPTGGSIVNYTYTNMAAGNYAVTSKGSGLNIYMIVIEYVY